MFKPLRLHPLRSSVGTDLSSKFVWMRRCWEVLGCRCRGFYENLRKVAFWNMSCSVVDSFWDTFTIFHNHSRYFGILVLAIWQAGASAMIIFEQFPDAQEGFWAESDWNSREISTLHFVSLCVADTVWLPKSSSHSCCEAAMNDLNGKACGSNSCFLYWYPYVERLRTFSAYLSSLNFMHLGSLGIRFCGPVFPTIQSADGYPWHWCATCFEDGAISRCSMVWKEPWESTGQTTLPCLHRAKLRYWSFRFVHKW